MNREKGLAWRQFERDSCGFGLIAHMNGQESSWLVQAAIESLSRLSHRGAVAADGKTGDGCGLLLKIPQEFMRQIGGDSGITLGKQFAVGSVFLDRNPKKAGKTRFLIETSIQNKGLDVAGWREVPVNTSACGKASLQTLPQVMQFFVSADHLEVKEFERKLFIARRLAEIEIASSSLNAFITCLSPHLISYKGLVLPEILPKFYPDLCHPLLRSSICLFHQRFSTNTLPRWELAQPFRFLAHNGEINTISGNRNWMKARAGLFKSPLIPEIQDLKPLVDQQGSDSLSLDNMLELLMMGGKDIFTSMRTIIPPAWQNAGHFDPDLRAFYEYSTGLSEPWDGPAGIAITDGRYAICAMDRNGLRPVRYVITRDRVILLASETGVYDFPTHKITTQGRLGPGEMISVDTQTGRLLNSTNIDEYLKNAHPYRNWLRKHLNRLSSAEDARDCKAMKNRELLIYEKLFGLTFEEKEQVLKVLAKEALEATGSMGDDTPLPILSQRPRSLFDNFRQQFAQVTNPPIDSIREKMVMSLESVFGPEINPFDDLPEDTYRLVLDSPVLSEYKFSRLLQDKNFKHAFYDLNVPYDKDWEYTISEMLIQIVNDIKHEKIDIIMLSDRNISPKTIPIHALLAIGAVHHRLSNLGLRSGVNLVVETAVARDPHHFAMLIGFGATAVFPYLALQSLYIQHGKDLDAMHATSSSYRAGINKGLYKIISKMGISSIISYRGAQLAEIVGLNRKVVNLCFCGAVSRIEGASFEDLREDQLQLAKHAWHTQTNLSHGGLLKYSQGHEYHAFNPEVVQSLHHAVRSGKYTDYRTFSNHVNMRPPAVLRDLLTLRKAKNPIPLHTVERAKTIVKRFDSAGMSLGSLSREAHETLARTMNTLGGRSNSGEGGEDSSRFHTDRVSKIKQIASGRFGVTPHYLVNAEVLQIKIAQGAKPGEGGQLPGTKVDPFIARLRHASPGVSLISPPPHHDIYSIEDLAQLIFDLKQVNPRALVSVKLVAEPGVGTVAVGVAKAYADFITISGYDGGTGASPLTSIKYAGSPWELGLPETHQALCANNLRGKVRLQTDGGLKTGLDVVKAALLGAESFGFGTAPMIAMGCKYLRICHLNNCATGIATQNKKLREEHFVGKVQMVKTYFMSVAQEVREIMAGLGIERFKNLIGRNDLLEVTQGTSRRQRGLDFSAVLLPTDRSKPQFQSVKRNKPRDKCTLANAIWKDCKRAVQEDIGGVFFYKIKNTDRSIGAHLSGKFAELHGASGVNVPVSLRFEGVAGQSFGAWNSAGLRLYLEGVANDYVGKGMAGGDIVITPPRDSTYASHDNVIAGNTCLYGATGGRMYLAGIAGERFAVRNSGAIAVTEGAGQHCCEYMTDGIVVVLGKTGSNFAAGMTGGLAFVLDEDHQFADRYNHDLVETYRMDVESMGVERKLLYSLILEHSLQTKSVWSAEVHRRFFEYLPQFWVVKPKAANITSVVNILQKSAS